MLLLTDAREDRRPKGVQLPLPDPHIEVAVRWSSYRVGDRLQGDKKETEYFVIAPGWRIKLPFAREGH
jgi:hypothetical protein